MRAGGLFDLYWLGEVSVCHLPSNAQNKGKDSNQMIQPELDRHANQRKKSDDKKVQILETCVYCGIRMNGNRTVDHVPPKSSFERQFRRFLPTVPSCNSCNNGASMDDEYFKRIFLSKETSNSPYAAKVIASFMRNLDREESQGHKEEFINSLSQISEYDENGREYQTAEYKVDLQRIGNVVFRTVKGLLWVETGMRLPDEAGIVMAPYMNLKFLDLHILEVFLHILLAQETATKNRKIIIPDVFEYWWGQLFPGGVLSSAWVMRFYKNAYFICLLDPSKQRLLQQFKPAVDSNLIAISI